MERLLKQLNFPMKQLHCRLAEHWYRACFHQGLKAPDIDNEKFELFRKKLTFEELENHYPGLIPLRERHSLGVLQYLKKLQAALDTDQIVDIETHMDHGIDRSVLVLTLKSGKKTVYKPACLKSTEAFGQLIQTLNQHGLNPQLTFCQVECHQNYGFLEFLEQKPIPEEEKPLFYSRCGALFAIAIIFRASRLHRSNLICRGAEPLFFDLETLIPPLAPLPTPADYGKLVKKTHLIPQSVTGFDQLPAFSSELYQHWERFEAGFDQAFSLLLSLSAEEVIGPFEESELRFNPRLSPEYLKLLRITTAPHTLANPDAARVRVKKQLANGEFPQLIEVELEQLMLGRQPLFSVVAGQTHVRCNGDNLPFDLLPAPPIDGAYAFFKSLSQGDGEHFLRLARQYSKFV